MKSTTIMVIFWLLGLVSIGLILIFSIISGIVILPIAIGSIGYIFYKVSKIK